MGQERKTRYHRGRYSGPAIKRNIRCPVFVLIGPNSTSCLTFHLYGRKRCKAIDNINQLSIRVKLLIKETRAVKRFKNILLLADQGTGGKAILRRAASLAETNRAIHKKGFDELIGKYSVKNLNHRLHFLKGFVSPVKLKAASVPEMP
jgi:hypothetical protein